MTNLWQMLSQFIVPLIPALLVVCATIVIIKLIHRQSLLAVGDRRFRHQLMAFFAMLSAVIGLILTLPISDGTRGQLLTVLGLLLTAVVTLSSSTIAANAMAGIMLRSLKSYTAGDFIQVGEHFGRVTDRDLFHTEIQTRDRDLLTMPNTYLASNPVKVVHASGTVISAEVSLGYDTDHAVIEGLLLAAAEQAKLVDPFVHVVSLGDFSVVYRVSGFLEDVKQMLSVRSHLHKAILDSIHGAGIEIVSPAFMNQRPVQHAVIPQRSRRREGTEPEPEKLIFDKADRAERVEELRETHKGLQEELTELKKANLAAEEKQQLLDKKARRLKAVERILSMLDEKTK